MSSNDSKQPKQVSKRGDSQQQAQGGQAQQSGEGQQYGEGNYAATRQYNEGLKEHIENHDIEKEARDAAPRSAAEEKEMEEAERIGRGKSRGEGKSPDADDEPDR